MSYNHLTLTECARIEALRQKNYSLRPIARKLKRPASTISREISRNNLNQSYQVETVQKNYETKRKLYGRLTRSTPGLGNIVKYYLKCHWSPEQIIGRLLQNQICFKTVYRWINSSMINFKSILCLRQKGKRQEPKEIRGKLNVGRSISQRSKEIKKRNTFGHWEADTIVSSRGKSRGCIATLAERKSRYYCYVLMPDRSSNSMETATNNLIKYLPKGAVKTITVDRGKGFSCYQNIENQFNINVYFADPYSIWQRGINENTNGLLREFFLRKTDLTKVNQEQFSYVLDLINYRLRKCLNWRFPYEVLCGELLHLG